MSQDVLSQLAPTGVLRAGINLGNFLLVTGRGASGEPEGVSPDMARAIADRLKATPAQVALAWVLAQGKDIVPIPGTKRRTYLDQNLDAESLFLGEEELRELDGLASLVSGERYHSAMMRLVER